MIRYDRLPPHLDDLIVASLEGIISPEQQIQLNEYLVQNTDAQQFYVNFLNVTVGLRLILSDIAGRQEEAEGTSGARPRSTVDKLVREIQFASEATPEERQSEKAAKPFKSDIFRQVIEQDLHDSVVRKALEEAAREQVNKVQGRTGGGYQRKRPSRRDVISAVFKVAAMICLAGGLIWLDRSLWRWVGRTDIRSSEPVAYLTSMVDARWSDQIGPLKPDTPLYREQLDLQEGLAKLTYADGSTVICQGPVVFTLEGSDSLFLKQGQVTVRVPKGVENFTVRSPYASVVDYGTEFGLTVDELGNAETHVYEGQVELRVGSNPLVFEKALRLTAGQAGRADTQGVLTQPRFDAFQYVRNKEYIARQKAVEGSPYDRWLNNSYALRRHKDLVAYYAFEKSLDNPNLVVNAAQRTKGSLDGWIESYAKTASTPEWGQDRWPEKTALRLDRERKQCVRVKASKAICLSGPITIAAWVKFDESDRGGHIVSSREGFMTNYQFAWLGPSEGQRSRELFCLQFLRNDHHANAIFSKPVQLSGQWHFVGVTHDNHTVTFYVDGAVWDQQEQEFHTEPVMADMAIGEVPDRTISEKWAGYLDGWVGEVTIFDRDLSVTEMKELYQQTDQQTN